MRVTPKTVTTVLLSCLSCLVGAALVVGCSADGSSNAFATSGGPAEPSQPGATLPPPSAGSSDGDGGALGAKPDAGKDAGPALPAPGDPCSKVNQIFERPCGACGEQSAICLPAEGGAPRVSDYSACTGELAGGCVPGATDSVACGNCGTQKKTCTASCTWSTSTCAAPPGACKAGTTEYTIAGCAMASTYRARTCSAACAWSSYSACAAPVNENVVDVNPTAGLWSTAQVTLSASKVAPALDWDGGCPVTSLVPGSFPYTYLEIRNTTGKRATVSVSSSTPAGVSDLYVTFAAYGLPIAPSSDAARLACTHGPEEEIDFVEIEPGASVVVLVQAYDTYDAAYPEETTGVLNVLVSTYSLM